MPPPVWYATSVFITQGQVLVFFLAAFRWKAYRLRTVIQREPAAAALLRRFPGRRGDAHTHKSRTFFPHTALKVFLYSWKDECSALLMLMREQRLLKAAFNKRFQQSVGGRDS